MENLSSEPVTELPEVEQSTAEKISDLETLEIPIIDTNNIAEKPEFSGEKIGQATEKKKRKYTKKQKKIFESPESLGKKLQGLHLLVALATSTPELQLTDDESITLAESVLTVAAEYDFAPDGKAVAFVQLIGVCAIIYVPRFLELKKRVTNQQDAINQ